jgi:hypothetical protein
MQGSIATLLARVKLWLHRKVTCCNVFYLHEKWLSQKLVSPSLQTMYHYCHILLMNEVSPFTILEIPSLKRKLDVHTVSKPLQWHSLRNPSTLQMISQSLVSSTQ